MVPYSFEAMSAAGIKAIGTKCSPYTLIQDGDETFAIINAGWRTIGVPKTDIDGYRLNHLDANNLTNIVKVVRRFHDPSIIVVTLHWNYELEYYPHPAQRILGQSLIDVGANYIIGHHPHMVGPVEYYKHGAIYYSIGNWWIPHNIYYNGKLSYDPISNEQYLLKIDKISGVKVYSVDFNPLKNSLEDLVLNKELDVIDVPIDKYHNFFKLHRRKKLGLPIYKDFRNTLVCKMQDLYVSFRARIVKIINKIFFKGI